MKKAFFLSVALLLGGMSTTASADNILNPGGIRTKIYSFSNKSFDGAERESRSMPAISGINNNGPLNIVYIESDKSEVYVEGDKELFCRVQTQYKNGTVNVSLEPGTYRNLWLQVVVYAPSLNSMKCTGSGNIKADKVTSTAKEMNVKVTGSATISIGQLTCENDLDLHISGSGDIRTDNLTCQALDINVTGSGDVITQKTRCNEVDCHITGSGGAKFNDIESNTGKLIVAGSGEIRLKEGEIKSVTARVTGSGDITGNIRYNALEKKVSGSGTISLAK